MGAQLSESEGQRSPEPVSGSQPSPVPRNAFSVDVEDYFQVGLFENIIDRSQWDSLEHRVENNTYRLLDLLDRFGIKATFFVLGWIAERWPQLVRRIQNGGHELGSHGYDHRPLTALSPEDFREDLRRSKQLIEEASGERVIGYRAPSYSVVRETFWALEILLEEGFQYDSSIFPIVHDRYGVPDFQRFPGPVTTQNGSSLVEFPISTVRVGKFNFPFVGGGYIRQLPMWFVRWGMERVNRTEGKPVIVYIHPWEIDPDQPRQPVGWLKRVRHYRNLQSTQARLETLFRQFSFCPVREVLGL